MRLHGSSPRIAVDGPRDPETQSQVQIGRDLIAKYREPFRVLAGRP